MLIKGIQIQIDVDGRVRRLGVVPTTTIAEDGSVADEKAFAAVCDEARKELDGRHDLDGIVFVPAQS